MFQPMKTLSFQRFTFLRDEHVLIGDREEFFENELFGKLSENSVEKGFAIKFPQSDTVEHFIYAHDLWEDGRKAGFLFKGVNADLNLKVKIYI